jgi:hypothetical protein
MDNQVEIHGRRIGLSKDDDLLLNGEIAVPNVKLVSLSAATSITRDLHSERVNYINSAAGRAFVLPAATGTGVRYRFVNGATVTSSAHTIKVARAADVMIGKALVCADGGDTVVGFECAADTDTISLNGSTTGGLKGDFIEIIDVAPNVFFVDLRLSATGVEATPFSATV